MRNSMTLDDAITNSVFGCRGCNCPACRRSCVSKFSLQVATALSGRDWPLRGLVVFGFLASWTLQHLARYSWLSRAHQGRESVLDYHSQACVRVRNNQQRWPGMGTEMTVFPSKIHFTVSVHSCSNAFAADTWLGC
jgi:hypothetical protein